MSSRNKLSKLSVLLLSLLFLIKNTHASEVILSRLENFDTCGGEFTGYQYTITSPNYPENYSENQDCVYKLHGSPFAKCNQVFHVQFLNFTLRSSKNCQQDYLSIDDRNIFCGRVIGIKSFSSKNNTLKLQFHSDNGSDKGFKLLITTLPCSAIQNSLQNVGSKQPTTKSAESVTKQPSIDYEKAYPVYRPNNVFGTEDVKSNNHVRSPSKITAYFYEAPEFDSKFSVDTSEKLKLSTLDSLPNPESAYYTNIQNLTKTKLIKSKSSVDNNKKVNEKLIVPFNSYGVPAGKPYAPLPGFSPAQIQTGEVSEIERDNIDCDGRINIPNVGVPLSEQPFDSPPVFDNNYPSVDSPGINSYPATTYGAPGSPFPPPPVANVPFNPTNINYNDNGFGGPFSIPPQPNFDDNINIINNNNNFIPSTNVVGVPEVRQCCNNQYNFPKFLITSPGFPSLFYSSNYYDCIYTINPLPNACRLRINFKYFNHGLDEAFCANGFVEIDGRKYCGCKTGFSLVVSVVNYLPKFIRVRYSGYPRTKFGGFVLEVTQEFPSVPYNNYPYLSRSKKSAENLTKIEILGIGRTKRELGYFYPKPNIVFDERVPTHREIGNVIHGFVSHAACLAFNFASWTMASKEVSARGARCFWNSGNGQVPGVILFPGNGNNGCLPPNNNCLPQNNGCLPPNNNCLPQNNNCLPLNNNCLPQNNNCLPPNINCLPTNNLSGPINPPTNPGYLPPGPNYPNNNENIDVPPVSVVPNYPNSGNGAPSGNCKLVSVKEGIISSPLYPSAYQNNLNVCYRFVRAPNHCRLQLSILDFDLENSLNCSKDFVIFGNQFTRYCGRSVAGSKTLLSFPRNDIVDVRFVTDSYGTARGFNIAFSQVSCTLG